MVGLSKSHGKEQSNASDLQPEAIFSRNAYRSYGFSGRADLGWSRRIRPQGCHWYFRQHHHGQSKFARDIRALKHSGEHRYLWRGTTPLPTGELSRQEFTGLGLVSGPVCTFGAEGQNRTGDTMIFSHVLYQLSYLGTRTYSSRGSAPRTSRWGRVLNTARGQRRPGRVTIAARKGRLNAVHAN